MFLSLLSSISSVYQFIFPLAVCCYSRPIYNAVMKKFLEASAGYALCVSIIPVRSQASTVSVT